MRRLLVVDDSAAERANIGRVALAEKRFDEVLEASDGLEAIKLLSSAGVDMVVCDLEMPRLGGDKLLEIARSPALASVPFLMLSATLDAKTRAALLRRGARDVMAKPVDPMELSARIDLHLEIARLQREMSERNELLERLSCTDALTQLHNRRSLEQAASLEWKRSRRLGTPFAVILADLDHFKSVNDEHGHAIGDLVLKEVGARLGRRIRATDTVGRFGGEEFMAIVAARFDGAATLAELLRRDVESIAIMLPSGDCVRPTISLGVAVRLVSHASASDVIAAADAALYCAKAAGRNCVRTANAPVAARA
jgi:two-component system cell cycle response regulator